MVKRPSHVPDRSQNSLTNAAGSIIYLVIGCKFDRSARLIRDFATIDSIFALASLRASNRSFLYTLVLFYPETLGNTPNNRSCGTNPFAPIVSLIDLLSMRNIILSDSLWYSFFTSLNLLRSGQWFRSPFPMEFCGSTTMNRRCFAISISFSVNSFDTNEDSWYNLIAFGKPLYTDAQWVKSIHRSYYNFPLKLYFFGVM